jgi:hypothetical protein
MDNVDGAIRAFINDAAMQKRLAKYLVQRCFRNSALEHLHAGTAPIRRPEIIPMRWSSRRSVRFPGVGSRDSMMER